MTLMTNWWMVRAGDDNELIQPFLEHGIAAIGWPQLGDPKKYSKKEDFLEHSSRAYKTENPLTCSTAANQVWRIAHEPKVGDKVITFFKTKRFYYIGEIMAEHFYAHGETYPNQIKVKWYEKIISKDLLSRKSQNSLGSTLTFFNVNDSGQEINKLHNYGAQRNEDLNTKKIILIKINQSYDRGMSAEELYEATSGVWKINETTMKNSDFQYYCPVYDNKILEVYKLNDYQVVSHEGNKRIRFNGEKAIDEIRPKLLGRDVKSIHNSSGNPIRYTNIYEILHQNSIQEEEITLEKWTELLKDNEVFREEDLHLLKRMYRMGGEATASQLAEEVGDHFSAYNSRIVHLAKRIQSITACPIVLRENGKECWWCILFEGEELINGHFKWIMKDNLKEAFSGIVDLDPDVDKNEIYLKEDFLKEVFLEEDTYLNIQGLLNYKKNIILQGSPGVGKTFVSKRFAYSLMGEMDENRLEMVQFHQNYSYEDFIMGYRPNEDKFELQKGIFYQFCEKALKDPEKDYYFIIDEINRGNLSKIFGELFMLIEADKRGEQVTLGYSQKKFTVPPNIYLIGTMNTADRSLAQLEIAMRRRFAFVNIIPNFNEKWELNLSEAGASQSIIMKIRDIVTYLNQEIESDYQLGPGYMIGHSFFTLFNKNMDENEWLLMIMNYEIRPLLEEYYFDRLEIVNELFEEFSL